MRVRRLALPARVRCTPMRLVPLVPLALLLLAAPLAAQDAAAPDAEAAVAAYVEAFAAADYVAAARLLDPDELAEFMGLMARLSEVGGEGLFDVDPDAAPPEAFAAFLERVMGAEPLMGEALETIRADVVGSVAEGDTLRHVVVRSRFEVGGAEMGGTQLVTARWTGDRWAVTFDARMQQFRAGLEAALAAEAAAEGDG